MRHAVSAFIAGLIFGLGLIISEMINPRRVIGFLDITGAWDPTLVFVMGGALIVTAIGFRLVLARPQPVYADEFHVPQTTRIDRPLVLGAALFGAGWGLIGLCPGPAIAALSTARLDAIVFFVCMAAGMKAHDLATRKSAD